MWIEQGSNKWIVFIFFAVIAIANELIVPANYRLFVLIILLLIIIILFLIDKGISKKGQQS